MSTDTEYENRLTAPLVSNIAVSPLILRRTHWKMQRYALQMADEPITYLKDVREREQTLHGSTNTWLKRDSSTSGNLADKWLWRTTKQSCSNELFVWKPIVSVFPAFLVHTSSVCQQMRQYRCVRFFLRQRQKHQSYEREVATD
ncbi:unnamed protein product [Soboliphyme baturini]|uniref:Uncharacterized protein n=1 Tax=Soboliphyme baturini TaxID=241478 RepID=A0A183ICE7_9BILA|nr:unnamed protein product [Soboliphyme baturini]